MESTTKKLFLLDAMALVYRAHFALIARPIFTSKGINTSALYGFTQTLLQILNEQKPTHLAVVFDTDAPTHRHKEFPEYKSQRQSMPEDLSAALPSIRRMIEAFNIPLLECDGCEADDIIGTLVKEAEKRGFTSYMVTPDKDFGQLVSERTFVYKPSRMGDGIEIMGVPEILARWGIQRTEQVVDILGLMGDTSDNIPGVPGVGEKTASKLISQFGTVENLITRSEELKGKIKETIETHREAALLSKKLARIHCDSPVSLEIEDLRLRGRNDEAVKALCVEFEFNTIGKRLFGDEFKAGRGFSPAPKTKEAEFNFTEKPEAPAAFANLKTLKDVAHEYQTLGAKDWPDLRAQLRAAECFSLAIECSHPDPKQTCITGLAIATEPQKAYSWTSPKRVRRKYGSSRNWVRSWATQNLRSLAMT
jgi:DNA polymerase I